MSVFRAAFTLTELLITVAIIVVLAALLMPIVSVLMSRSEIASAGSNVQILTNACHSYRLGDFGKRPPGYLRSSPTAPLLLQYTLDDSNPGVLDLLDALDTISLPEMTLDSDRVILDPWGNRYQYTVAGDSGRPYATGIIDDWNNADLDGDGTADPEDEFIYIYSTGPDPSDPANSIIYVTDTGSLVER